MDKAYLLPLSILVGCTIIGGGLYFGLRQQAVAPLPDASATAQSTAPASPPATATVAALPMIPGPFGIPVQQVPPDIQAATEAAAKVALEKAKKEIFIPKCYAPGIAQQAEPKHIKLTYDLTFNAQGEEIMRGISEDRSAMRADIAICLRNLPDQLKLSYQPGMNVRVLPLVEFP
ncbi:MAG: hypothetical protein IPK82_22385 [Polyangiaceae bacterium]|nr:hypothetical protein [Polyangiaceae bacterium]